MIDDRLLTDGGTVAMLDASRVARPTNIWTPIVETDHLYLAVSD
jgi:hypothetical protein